MGGKCKILDWQCDGFKCVLNCMTLNDGRVGFKIKKRHWREQDI